MPRLRPDDADQREERGAGRDFSEALARGLSVLLAFDADHRALTLADVARRIDLPRATARRALLTLRHLGFLELEGRLFRPTPRVLRLAASYLASSAATAILQPACEALSLELGEACSVAVLDGAQAVMIAYASPRRLYVEGAGPGLRLPAHCSAVGRVLLAALPPERRSAFLRDTEIAALTDRTVTDRAVLATLLEEVGHSGYAVSDGEAEAGFRSVAVPLRRQDNRVVAALNVGTRVETMRVQDLVGTVLPRLRAKAEELRAQLV